MGNEEPLEESIQSIIRSSEYSVSQSGDEQDALSISERDPVATRV